MSDKPFSILSKGVGEQAEISKTSLCFLPYLLFNLISVLRLTCEGSWSEGAGPGAKNGGLPEGSRRGL